MSFNQTISNFTECQVTAYGLAEVKRRSTEILETWFNFHFSFNVIKQLQSFVSVNTSFYGPYKSIFTSAMIANKIV
jgi:hypothetical protein